MDRKALVGGTVIDGTGRPPLANAIVTICGDRIDNVFRAGDYELPPDTELIDASNKWILPGLVDCHTHIAGLADDSFVKSEDPLAVVDRWMRESLQHGITTVRDTGNYDPDQGHKIAKQPKAEWPRFFGAGPVLDGRGDPPTPWRWLWVVEDEKSAREKVRQVIDLGVDFIKVYVWMKPAVLRAVVEEAHSLGTRVAGHVGHVLTVEEAVRIGVDTLEHVRMGPELVSEGDRGALKALRQRALDPVASWKSWRYVDPTSKRADDLIALIAERGVFFTPTLTWSQSILKSDVPEVKSPPGMESMPPSVLKTWSDFSYTFDYTEEDFRQAKVELTRQMQFVGRAQRGGVKVLAGTDTTNPSVIPGASLHDELGLLVQSGLSPMEALVAATSRAAEVLGQQASLGTVEKTKLADLLVLEADPLQDIGNTRRIWAVFKSGQRVHGRTPVRA